METAGIAELKKRMEALSPKALKELCIRLARYKKENKELLHYLLFYANDEEQYIGEVKEELISAFEAVNTTNLYWAKKTVRKVLKIANQHIKYSGNKQTEAELLICFCGEMKGKVKGFSRNPVLRNLYERQLQRIQKAIQSLHEDLQYDYAAIIADLEL